MQFVSGFSVPQPNIEADRNFSVEFYTPDTIEQARPLNSYMVVYLSAECSGVAIDKASFAKDSLEFLSAVRLCQYESETIHLQGVKVVKKFKDDMQYSTFQDAIR